MRGKRARAQVFVDLGADSIKVWARESADLPGRGLEASFARDAAGAVEAASVEEAVARVRSFLEGLGSLPRAAECAIPAQGVSLRRLSVPAVEREERESMLALQLERELPSGSADLVWAHRLVPASSNGTSAEAEKSEKVVVAALRADLVEQHRALLSRCGLEPRMSLGVLASRRLFDRIPGLAVIADIGRTRTELLALEDGCPTAVRSLAFGGEHVSREIARELDLPLDAAEARKRAAERDPRVEEAIESALDVGARRIVRVVREMTNARDDGDWTICLAGGGAELEGWPRALERARGAPITCLRAPRERSSGFSAVNAGLLRSTNAGVAPIHLGLDARDTTRRVAAAGRAWRFWALLAVLLLSVVAALRYLPGWWRARGLEETLASRRAERDVLPSLDAELAFLDAVAGARVPYLDAFAVLAVIAPNGSVFESLSISRRGEVSLEARVPSLETMHEFRSGVVASPWFGDVVLHEYSVSGDEQKKGVNFRLSAFLRVDPRELPPIPAGDAATPGSPPSVAPPAAGEAAPDAGSANPAEPSTDATPAAVPAELGEGAAEVGEAATPEVTSPSSSPPAIRPPTPSPPALDAAHRAAVLRVLEANEEIRLEGATIEIDLEELRSAPGLAPVSGGKSPDA